MKRIFGFASLIGFVAALVVHIAAVMGIDVSEKFPAVWGLHVGIFLVFIPFVFYTRRYPDSTPSLAQARATFPLWLVGLGFCIFAYALVNFSLFMLKTEGGNPSVVDGKFMLMNHGEIVRELSAAEYAHFRANEVRSFSGHWLLFYFAPFAYFMFYKDASSLTPAHSERADTGMELE